MSSRHGAVAVPARKVEFLGRRRSCRRSSRRVLLRVLVNDLLRSCLLTIECGLDVRLLAEQDGVDCGLEALWPKCAFDAGHLRQDDHAFGRTRRDGSDSWCVSGELRVV